MGAQHNHIITQIQGHFSAILVLSLYILAMWITLPMMTDDKKESSTYLKLFKSSLNKIEAKRL